MSRDFLNKGHRVQDRSVAIAAIAEADPTLVTDGIGLPLNIGSLQTSPPYILVVVDFAGGAAPTVDLEFWGYFTPPAAGSALQSEWQHIASATLSDAVGVTPTLALFPIVGMNRYSIITKAATGAPTSVGIREIAVSNDTAEFLITSGIIPPAATAEVDIVKIDGVAVSSAAGVLDIGVSTVGGSAVASTGVSGTVPSEGTVAHDSPEDGSYPLGMGAIGRASLPTAVANGDRVKRIADIYGRDIGSAFDFTSTSNRVTIVNPDYSQRDPIVLVNNTTGITDGTYYFYWSPADFGRWSTRFSIYGGAAGAGAGITLTLESTDEPDEPDQTLCTYDDVTSLVTGVASYTAGPTVTTIVKIIDNDGVLATQTFIRIKLVCAGGAGDDCQAVGWLNQRV